VKKQNKAQLEFELAKTNLNEAFDRFESAAVKLAQSEPKKVKSEAKQVRKTINRLVRHLATQSYEDNFRAAWIDVYKVMGRIFHYNPASKAVSANRPHIDICEEDGKLQQLLQIVQAMVANEAADAR